VVKFYNGRGTAEQWIKEGKNAVKWTRLSCHDFVRRRRGWSARIGNERLCGGRVWAKAWPGNGRIVSPMSRKNAC